MIMTDDSVHKNAAPCLRATLHGEGNMISSLSIVIPVYNSETTIGKVVDEVVSVLQPEFGKLEVILVDDGSADDSYKSMAEATIRHPGMVKSVRLARNFGEHNAVLCGMGYATCDCTAVIDDDFQNPPEEILFLVDELRKGYDVVYSRYAKKHHHWFRNLGSYFNDRVAVLLLRKPSKLYLSSFKVMNAFLVRKVCEYDGPFPYIDGIILRTTSAIGTRLCKHRKREHGESNYTLHKLMRLWLNMFTGYSIVPLRAAAVLGGGMALAGLFLAIHFVVVRLTGWNLLGNDVPPGWASLIVCITVFSGVQLCVLGVIGEYLGRLFLSVNRMPQFVVRETHDGTKLEGE